MTIRAFLWWVALFLVMGIVFVAATGTAQSALSPPVKYVGGAPCRTVALSKATFRLDGRTYRLTHLTWCGKRVTTRITEVK